MPPKLTKWLILIALSAYAVFVSAWADSTMRTRPCTGVEVDIREPAPGVPSLLKPSAVLAELGPLGTSATSRSLWGIDTDSLERRLNALNNFEHAEVVRTSGGKLLISVLPLQPEARIFTGAGSYYINKDGKRMDATAGFFVDLPVVHGNFTHRMPASGVLPVVRRVASDPVLRDLVTMIEYRSPSDIILIPRIRGHVINLGDTTALDDKIARLMLMYRKVLPYKGWNTYDTISLKFRDQIVATRADKRTRLHGNPAAADSVDVEEQSIPAVADLNETTLNQERQHTHNP